MPFRGEYYELCRAERATRARPDLPGARPRVPVPGRALHPHDRRRRGGGPERGARLRARGLLARHDVRPGDLLEHAGLRRLLAAWRASTGGWAPARCTARRARPPSCAALQQLVPDIRSADLERGGAGVRAQAVAPDGTLVDDFKISVTPGAVHVVNAPSPAATASLAIGRHVAGVAARDRASGGLGAA